MGGEGRTTDNVGSKVWEPGPRKFRFVHPGVGPEFRGGQAGGQRPDTQNPCMDTETQSQRSRHFSPTVTNTPTRPLNISSSLSSRHPGGGHDPYSRGSCVGTGTGTVSPTPSRWVVCDRPLS